MTDDVFRQRERAMEEEFFSRQNRALLERLRQKREHAEQRAALAEACGVSDPVLLDELMDFGITEATLTALSVVPLVAVAWADGRIEPGERRAITRAAGDFYAAEDTAAWKLLEHWLAEQPDPALFDTWAEYMKDLSPRLTPELREQLREKTVSRARDVAEASGGFLGTEPRVSKKEKTILHFVEAAFNA